MYSLLPFVASSTIISLVKYMHIMLQISDLGGVVDLPAFLLFCFHACMCTQSIILWSCRHVTEAGLVALVNKCRRLECINVGGMRVPPESFVGLLSISPALQIRSIHRILNAGVGVQVS